MRRIAALALVLLVAFAGGVSAQGPSEPSPRNESIYQGLWCLYLHAKPYLIKVPADVVCDYEPSPMTVEEAGALYQRLAQDSNYLGYQRDCAGQKSKSGDLSWKQRQKWAKRVLKLGKQHQKVVRSVMWPQSVKKKVAKYLDLEAAEDLARKQAYRPNSAAKSVLSGAWSNYMKANDKRGDVSAQLRRALNIPDLPTPSNDCKAAKRYEKNRAKARAEFNNPFAHPALKRVATLLAQSGLVETQLNDAGEPSLFLTGQGLETARSMPAIGETATPEEVVAGLFTPVETATPEPSPSPSSEPVELTLPEG